MSVELAIARVTELQRRMLLASSPAAPAQPPVAATAATAAGSQAQTTPTFQAMLGQAVGQPAGAGVAPIAGGTPAGQAMVRLAQAEVGVAEQPPGSNDSPRIAQYRQATAGAGVGPWCAYFLSWLGRSAGAPLGDSGQGYGRVDDVASWAQRTGRWTQAAGSTPSPGDLIVWDEHIGIVESVDPDGSVRTIEGNSSDKVQRRTYPSGGGGALGYVRIG